MHWIEGIIMIGAGCIPWLIAAGKFPADPLTRDEMLMKAPWLGKKNSCGGWPSFSGFSVWPLSRD